MRLSALDLIRYGKFTDRRLIFGPAEPGRPDLHIVYGPNEAGKSTLFSAVLDLFFGIETRSTYGFLHPYETMRIGGLVETGGTSHAVARLKRRQNTLVGPDDQPLPEGLFAAALAGIDRGTYQTMFSLDDDSIEKGGDSILRSEGELGALLFSASSGLSDIGPLLTGLKGKADAFYRPQARKHRLAELKAELERLKTERAAIDVSHSQFSAMRKALEAARGHYEMAVAERAELRLALDMARLQQGALPMRARLRALEAERARFDDTPPPPEAWHRLLPDLMREETELSMTGRQIAHDLEALEETLAGLGQDPRILALAADIRAVAAGGSEARYRTAVEDLPARRAERDRVATALSAKLVQAGRAGDEDPTPLLLPAARIGRLRMLGEAYGRLRERAEAAVREHGRASALLRDLDAAAEDAAQRAEQPSAHPGLADLFRQLRRQDFAGRRRTAQAALEEAEDALADQLATLGLADETDLGRIAVPSAAERAALAEETSTLSARVQRLDERLGEEAARLAAARATLAAEAAGSNFADDATAKALREARDRAWQKHRGTLDSTTADRFEAALSADDAASASRLAQADRLAARRALEQSVAELEARHQAGLAERAALRAAEETLSDRRLRLLEACGLPAETRLAAFAAWCERFERTLTLRATCRTSRRALAAVTEEEREALSSLSAFVGAERTDRGVEAALAAAEEMLEAEQAAEAAQRARTEQRVKAQAAHAARAQERAEAEEALAGWQAEWQAALEGSWLATLNGAESPAIIQPLLDLLATIESLASQKAGFDHRIDAMEADLSVFAQRLQTLAQAAGERGDEAPLDCLAALQARLAEAERVDVERERLVARQASRQADQAALADWIARHEAVRAAMAAHFGVSTLPEINVRLEEARARARIDSDIAERTQELCERLRVESRAAADDMLDELDPSLLDRSIAEIGTRLIQAEERLQERHTALRDAERILEKAAGSDEAAYLDERRRTVLAEIEEEALRYLRLRTGVLAGEMALRLYRERHRSAMMRRASDAFATISGGDYSGLSTESAKEGEYMIAHSADGGTKLASNLSKGTRFQLYLALRIAGFHEIAASREPLPFIADDIMETFDDNRAFHAFRLMGEMAGVGQVIYLTHHEHLCAIAEKACPGATLHRL